MAGPMGRDWPKAENLVKDLIQEGNDLADGAAWLMRPAARDRTYRKADWPVDCWTLATATTPLSSWNEGPRV